MSEPRFRIAWKVLRSDDGVRETEVGSGTTEGWSTPDGALYAVISDVRHMLASNPAGKDSGDEREVDHAG